MSDITLAQLTSGAIEGTGVFDELMKVTRLHLQAEYKAGRIKGPEYADVYMASINAVMAQAVQFLLQEQAADQQAELLAQQTANELTKNGLLIKQGLKLDAEIALLEQKTKSEKAQILDLVDGVPVVGTIGKQKNLYQAQTDGFARDAEQKLAKMYIDTWAVRRTTDEGTLVTGTGLTDADIKGAIDVARLGVGLAASVA